MYRCCLPALAGFVELLPRGSRTDSLAPAKGWVCRGWLFPAGLVWLATRARQSFMGSHVLRCASNLLARYALRRRSFSGNQVYATIQTCSPAMLFGD
jgi:hypothetical protein